MRVVIWSVGTTYFELGSRTNKKTVVKNVLTHPCLVAIYAGMFVMVTQLPLCGLITQTVQYVGSCNSALTMFIVGTILADAPIRNLFSRTAALFSVFRLVVLPAIALAAGLVLGLNQTALGVSVVMTGMPAGATTAIFAARYNSAPAFATQCVV